MYKLQNFLICDFFYAFNTNLVTDIKMYLVTIISILCHKFMENIIHKREYTYKNI